MLTAAPTSIAQPSAVDARAIAQKAFAFEQVSVELDLGGAPSSSPLLRDLLLRGVVYPIAYHTDECGAREVAVALTARGRRLAGEHGWLIRSQTLIVPVGVIVAEIKSAHSVATGDSRAIDVVVRWRPNNNFRILLRLAPSEEWKFLSNRWHVALNADNTVNERVVSLPIVYGGARRLGTRTGPSTT